MMDSNDDNNDRPEQPARDADEVRARHEANRASWNEGAVWYTDRIEEDIEFLRSGKSSVHPIERRNLGDLSPWCNRAIHLQCASGRDTLSLLAEGAREVVGVDISDRHIANATRTSDALGAPAQWFRCDVLDTPHELDGTADLVYTGRGAICWLHDMDAWAAVIHRLLKPGGVVHLYDDHPISWLFDINAETLIFSGNSYFDHAESSKGWPAVYIGELAIPLAEQTRKYERSWNISTMFMALHNAGLAVELFGEYPDRYWQAFDKLKPELEGKIPLSFAMMARKR
jgi:SAM-dependent methyltransferase